MRAYRRIPALALAVLLAAPSAAAAQEQALADACAEATVDYPLGPEDALEYCLQIAQAAASAQPRLGLAASMGNPVPGTASTLGMKIGSLPRMSLAGRLGAVWLELPPIRTFSDDFESEEAIGVLLPSLGADVAVGLFSGFSPAPTVGGVGSVDLLGSVGLLRAPDSDGFDGGMPLTWALGARVGLLRESFTLPGLSLTGMVRRVEDLEYGDESSPASFAVDATAWSARAALSKRLFMFGATAGVGYDHYGSDVRLRGRLPMGSTDMLTGTFNASVDGYEEDRVSAFVNLSWTLLVLHVVAEGGWQAGGDPVSGATEHPDFDAGSGTWFGGLSLRLSI